MRHLHQVAFWASTSALVLVVSGCALLLTLGLLTLLRWQLRRHDVRGRVEQFAPPLAPDALGRAPTHTAVAAVSTRDWADRLFGGHAWWGEFKERLEIARIERSPSGILLLTALASLALAAVLALVAGTVVLAIPALALGPAAMLAIVNSHLRRQRKQFAEQLPAHLEELASAMRAGHSLVGGLRTIASSAVEPMHTELERVLADEQLGVPLKDALGPTARRMDSDDVKQVALVAGLHERTGGNMATVLDHVAEGVREHMELRRELQSLTAQARLSRFIVTLLPPLLLLFITVEDPSYMRPLFHTATGLLLLLIASCMVIAGSLAMKAIVRVEA